MIKILVTILIYLKETLIMIIIFIYLILKDMLYLKKFYRKDYIFKYNLIKINLESILNR